MIVHLIDGTYELFRHYYGPLEEALEDLGVAVWPMVELEADDALASAAALAERERSVEQVCIWTPDKDLAQCVRGRRVVQIERRTRRIRDEAGVREKFGVAPTLIPDWLALVGDSSDGYPGIAGKGPVNAGGTALLFKQLATLKTDAPLFARIEDLRWTGTSNRFEATAARLGSSRLAARAAAAYMASLKTRAD